MKVFFPDVGDHPLFLNPHIHGVNKQRTELDNTMVQFESLLNNKWFLLAFSEAKIKSRQSLPSTVNSNNEFIHLTPKPRARQSPSSPGDEQKHSHQRSSSEFAPGLNANSHQ